MTQRMAVGQDDTESMLDQWVTAKRAHDFGTADRIRDKLRTRGVEPDKARPHSADHLSKQSFTEGTHVPQTHVRRDRRIPAGAIAQPPHMQKTMLPSDETQSMLDQWVAAKRAHDFGTADQIREELRARGVEPDKARPHNGEYPEKSFGLTQRSPRAHGYADRQMPSMAMVQPLVQPIMGRDDTEILLDQWVAAKRAHDFGTADQIREDLRVRGVEPDKARPHSAEPSEKLAGRARRASVRPAQQMIPVGMSQVLVSGKRPHLGLNGHLQHASTSRVQIPNIAVAQTLAPAKRARLGSHGHAEISVGQFQIPHTNLNSIPLQELVQRWEAAQVTADTMRAELARRGVEPVLDGGPGVMAYQAHPIHTGFSMDVEAMLDEWVAAKRAHDFDTADRIREELRTRGVQPDKARPPIGADLLENSSAAPLQLQRASAPIGGMYMVAEPFMNPVMSPRDGTGLMLDQWVTAKRAHDFGTADRIREELRARGVEPDKARPALPDLSEKSAVVKRSQQAPAKVPKQRAPVKSTDLLLDEWVAAKRAHDFGMADRIREELRTRGVRPDKARPRR